MLRAGRPWAVRNCLLFAGVLFSASVLVFGAGADPARAVASSYSNGADSLLPATGLSAPAAPQKASKRRASGGGASSGRRRRCAAAARVRGNRKARKACLKKRKANRSKPSVPRARGRVEPASSPSVEPSSAPTPAIDGAPPVEALKVGPVEPKTPVEPTTPSEPRLPVEEPKPPVEEPKPPVEESKPPVEPTPPVEESKPPVEEPKPVEPVAPFRFFSSTSFWNEALPADAALDPSSAGVVGTFDEEIGQAEEAKKALATINTTSWSVPIYTVLGSQPMVKVTLDYGVSAALQAAWSAVPLPPNAEPAAGSDKHLVVWQPSTDRMWEFWGLEQTDEGWQAAWGGAMEDVSTDKGVYGPEAWQGAASSWGASASSLPIAGGLITLEDLERGEIDHALAIAVPNVRAGAYASPAKRDDGYATSPLSLPEGAHLRLDPSLDLASLHLPRLTLMLAEAAQRYGIFVRDRASNVAFYAQDPIPTGTEPYAGAHGYYEGKSSQQILESFPWSHLQLLKMELHSSS